MIEASCHCGAVRLALPARPDRLNRCQCSICRRYGVSWCYYRPAEIAFVHGVGDTIAYVRDGGTLEFQRCARCGCVVSWRDPTPDADRIGVNANLIEPSVLAGVPVEVTEGPPE